MKELDEKKLKISSEKFRVNEVATFFGITPRVLKHYEAMGVLSPDRAENNDYREYSAEDVIKIQTAERLKRALLSLREIEGFFTGELDIESKRDELMALRTKIDNLIDLLDLELNDGKPKFYIENGRSLQCFCKPYAYNSDPLKWYLDSRDAYSSAIRAGCVCDVSHPFFFADNGLFPLPDPENWANAHSDRRYKVCVPIAAEPKKAYRDGTVENVTLKKSLAVKLSGGLPGNERIYYLLQEEADRRGLTLTGNAWFMSETGPNRKTANRTYTMHVGAEIE